MKYPLCSDEANLDQTICVADITKLWRRPGVSVQNLFNVEAIEKYKCRNSGVGLCHPFTPGNDPWVMRWYASAFLAGKLTLYPGRSLVHNIGNDNSGTHCGESSSLDSELSKTPINLSDILVQTLEIGMRAFEDFLRQIQTGLLQRLVRKANALLKGGR